MLQSESNQVTETKPVETDWRGLYKLGAFTALILIVLAPAEIIVGLLPGAERASASTVTVVDWFSLFHDNWFLGLRNLGLLNLVAAALLVPTILAVYSALRLATCIKLITAHLRNERFCDGYLHSVFESGHLTAILRRLKELSGTRLIDTNAD